MIQGLRVLNIIFKRSFKNCSCVIDIAKAHLDSVLCLKYLPNGKLASGSSDYSIKFWNVTTGICVNEIQYAHKGISLKYYYY
jgi:WD40 repeat protein